MIRINSVVLGDCLKVMRKLPDECIDLILTSPPYNLGIEYDGYDDSRSFKEYWRWCQEWVNEFARILKPDGRYAIVHYLSCGTSRYRFAPISRLESYCRRAGLKHHGIAIWEDRTLSKFTAWGSWRSASAPYINSPYEGILIGFKKYWKKQTHGKTAISRKEFMEACSGIWKIATERNREHPAPFPEALADRVINLLTYKGDLVLDPFCGSGTTLVSAKRLGRRFLGIEISPAYVRLAERNLKRLDRRLR